MAGPCVAQRVWPMPTSARDRMPPELFDQRVDAAGTFGDLQPAAADRGHARAVVAAVFEPPQPLDQKVDGIAPADITHDSAHAWFTFA